MDTFKLKIGAVFGVASSFLVKLLGGWDAPVETLVYFMIADYFTGLLLAGVFKKSPKTETGALSSNAGLQGLVKKALILIVVTLAVRLDMILGTGFIRNSCVFAFCANELLSISENVGLMLGYNVPAVIKNAIDMLIKNSNGEK